MSENPHYLVIERYPACASCDRWYEADMLPAFCHAHDCHTDLRDSNNVQWEMEYHVEHPDDCPDAVKWEGSLELGIPDVKDYICNVGEEISMVGLDALDIPAPYTLETLPEGKYEVEFWFVHYPGGYWGSDECDTGLNFVDLERDIALNKGVTP